MHNKTYEKCHDKNVGKASNVLAPEYSQNYCAAKRNHENYILIFTPQQGVPNKDPDDIKVWSLQAAPTDDKVAPVT